ncbi:transposase [Umezawaea beigongshangensis]|uniref:transposase n=1 Tax=Umezawaea beigongshangensis TaxID=2780383 RepID=UPI0027DD2495|nr:transposase [Umezawaea beigongshangensis]
MSAVVASQSVRAAQGVCRATRAWDGGKKVAGRKRHVVVDTAGLLVAVLVTPASTQDRVTARSLLRRTRDTAPDTAAASATTNDSATTTRPWSADP